MKRLLFLTPLLVASLLADAVDVRQEVVDGQAVSTVNDNFRRLDINKMTKSQTSSLVETAISDGITTDSLTATTVVASTLTVTNTITGGWLAAPYPMMIIEDQKASGTDGGTCTSGSWMTRDLNTVTTTTITGASLSSNQITLPSGGYFVQWSAPSTNTNGHQTLFTSTPTAVIVSTGTTEQAAGASPIQTRSTGSTMFSLSGNQAFELRHRCETTNASDGFGLGQGFTTEVYSRVEIWKLR